VYLQSQNGNIYRSEPDDSMEPDLSAFRSVVKRDVDWMAEATGESRIIRTWRQILTNKVHRPKQ